MSKPVKPVYRSRQLVNHPGSPGLLPISPATLWRWVRDGKFPQPFKLGPGVTVFDAAEVEAFIEAQRNATGGSAA